jgi:hypothetical protein
MEYDDYAEQSQQLTEKTDDLWVKEELLGLAAVCEEVTNNVEDHLTAD